jgi:hypothetical protein
VGEKLAMISKQPKLTFYILAGVILIILSMLLAWLSSGFLSISGWLNFGAVLVLASGILVLGWRSLAQETPPTWLAWVLLLAVLLRLGMGVFWTQALPVWGYGTDVEQAGYVLDDAYKRDPVAWELAVSERPLFHAFTAYRGSDQYGGFLFASALVYRYLGGSTHQPLLMVILCAAVSALAVLYTWGFARRLLNDQVAYFAAWGLAVYPEAVLLGSAQMRESVTLTFAAAAGYGLLRYRQDHRLANLFYFLIPIALSLVISPPSTALILLVLVVLALALDEFRLLRRKNLWLVLAGLMILAGIGIWLAWGQIAPEGVTNPFGLLDWWLRKSADYQAFLTKQASGWVQRIFRSTPEVLHLPLLVVYGIVQPFLPAAIFAGGAPIWQAIAVWRSLGWAVLLLLLIYALWVWVRSPRRSPAIGALHLILWLVILIASLRSGGDQWDNPRYRAILASFQIVVAAWGLVEGRRKADPWLKRILIAGLLVFAWFVPWYLRRYTPLTWPVVDPFKTLGLGLATAALYIVSDLVRLRKLAAPVPDEDSSHDL